MFASATFGDVLPRGHTPELVDTWGMEKGLPQDSVTAVIQTQDDYLWVGTEGGLARFDGLKFNTYRVTNTPELASNAVTSLFEDRSGILWIGTENGLTRYHRGEFTAMGLEGRRINDMSEDVEGGLWVATDVGVRSYRNGKLLPDSSDGSAPRRSAHCIFTDSAGRIWVGFSRLRGVLRFEQGKFERLETLEMRDIFRGEVLAIAEEPKGTLWFGTTNGLVRWQDGHFTRFGTEHGLAGDRVTALRADPIGGLWIASTRLQRVTHGDWQTLDTVTSLAPRVFRGMWKDGEGNLWAGTTEEGLVRVRRSMFQRIALDARSTTNGFRTVMQDGSGTVWLSQGALGYTTVAPDGEIERVAPRTEAAADEVLSVYVLRNGDQWVATRDATHITRDGKTEVYPELSRVRSIYEDRRGGVWIGRQNGGIVYWQDGVFREVPLPEVVARCTPSSFAENANGDIWAGTWLHGLLRLRGDEVTVFDRDSGLPTNEMRFVYVDRDDILWLGTKSRGLGVRYDDRWIVPEWTSDLIDQWVFSIIEDEADNLWLGSPRGAFMVSRSELLLAMRKKLPLNRLRVVNATEGLRDGIPDLACFPNIWRTTDGYIWLVTRRGVIRVDAPAARANPMPTVHIERVVVNGERHPVGPELVLPPDARSLAIEYTALSFTAPNWVRFQYRLEGFDDKWVDADDRRVAQYANLPSGRYRFHVIACNADGVWNDQGATLAIVQKAHFYTEPWAHWLFGFSLVGIGLGIFRWRITAHERERRRLEAGIAARTSELQIAKDHAEASTRAKAEFLESISHEIRNPLNGIIGLVAMLREAPLDVRERELSQSLGACAKGLTRVFDEVLTFTRLEHGYVAVRETPFALTALVEEVAALFRMMARQRGSEIVVRCESDMPEHWIGDGEKIKSILGNFVNNALKYAPGSQVDILLQCDALDDYGAEITFNVTDRGPGIPLEEQEQIFEKFVRGVNARENRTPGTGLGLAACRALAELLGGHVAVESEPGRGATFFLRLRLKRDRNPAPATAALVEATVPAAVGRALIVEDQPYNQLVVRRIAERLGFASDVARDGADALACLARQAYAVVFVDWELPGMRGDELARRIRALPGGGDVIVIATTAHDSEEIRRQCRAVGMDGFALKPFDTETISRLLAEARQRRGAATDRSAPLDTRVFRFVGYDDPEQAGQAAALYLDILDQEVALLDSALRHGDPDAAASAAHRIKSHAGLVEAADLREMADRVQREARTAPPAALAELHREVLRQAALLRERLKSWRDADAIG